MVLHLKTQSLLGPEWLRAAAVAMLMLVASAHADMQASNPAKTQVRTLMNGMKVIVREDARAPTAAQMLWYRAGSIDEVSGTTGVAHVLEHMMFKGTKTLAPGEFSRRVAALGGRENAFTSHDYTGYFQLIHRTAVPEVMALEADRMSNLRIDNEEFAKEIKVVMEERRWRTDDQPTAKVWEALMATAFTANPYRTPIVGWMSDLEQMTADDAREWYQRWYAPNNAVLTIVGDVKAEQVFEWAENTYGKVQPKPQPDRRVTAEPDQQGVRRISVKAPAQNPYFAMAWKVPVLRDVKNDTDPYALEVLSEALGASATGRMSRALVREQRVADQVGVGYDLTQRGPGLFLVDATPAQGQTSEAAEAAIRQEIQRISEMGVSDEELNRIKRAYIAARVYQRDSLYSQAMEMGRLEMAGLSWDAADEILNRIRTVTSEQIQAVAKRYFVDDALTVATLIPLPPDNKPRPLKFPGGRH